MDRFWLLFFIHNEYGKVWYCGTKDKAGYIWDNWPQHSQAQAVKGNRTD